MGGDRVSADDLRDTLAKVTAYRDLRNGVRKSGGHNLFWGLILLALWYAFYQRIGFQNPFSVIHFSLAMLEVLVGVWKWAAPSAECLLLDAVIFFSFAGSNLLRALVFNVAGNQTSLMVSIAFALYMGYHGYGHLQTYLALRRVFRERPSAAHIAYVDDLIREIRRSDPESDPTALDLPTRPRLKAKLLGGVAIFADAPGGVFVAEREAVQLDRRPPAVPGDPTVGVLRLFGQAYPAFELPDASWENYRRWKNS